MTSWVTLNHQKILDEHKAEYCAAATKSAENDVLKSIAKKLKEGGRKGLPKELSKV
jgi:hypothetical protein